MLKGLETQSGWFGIMTFFISKFTNNFKRISAARDWHLNCFVPPIRLPVKPLKLLKPNACYSKYQMSLKLRKRRAVEWILALT